MAEKELREDFEDGKGRSRWISQDEGEIAGKHIWNEGGKSLMISLVNWNFDANYEEKEAMEHVGRCLAGLHDKYETILLGKSLR